MFTARCQFLGKWSSVTNWLCPEFFRESTGPICMKILQMYTVMLWNCDGTWIEPGWNLDGIGRNYTYSTSSQLSVDCRSVHFYRSAGGQLR